MTIKSKELPTKDQYFWHYSDDRDAGGGPFDTETEAVKDARTDFADQGITKDKIVIVRSLKTFELEDDGEDDEEEEE